MAWYDMHFWNGWPENKLAAPCACALCTLFLHNAERFSLCICTKLQKRFKKMLNFSIFLKFREIPTNFHQNRTEKRWKSCEIAKFPEFCRKNIKICWKCWDFEFGAVRRNEDLLDLEKCEKMTPWTQKSASIQRRTSRLCLWLVQLCTSTSYF